MVDFSKQLYVNNFLNLNELLLFTQRLYLCKLLSRKVGMEGGRGDKRRDHADQAKIMQRYTQNRRFN